MGIKNKLNKIPSDMVTAGLYLIAGVISMFVLTCIVLAIKVMFF